MLAGAGAMSVQDRETGDVGGPPDDREAGGGGGPADAREPASARERPARRPRRGRLTALLAAAALVTAAAVATALTVAPRNHAPETTRTAPSPTLAPASTAASTAAAPGAGPAVNDAVDAVLRTATAAVVKHRLDAYLSTFDPSNADLLAHERQVFANLMMLPLGGFSLARNWEHDAQPASRSRALPAGAVVVRTLLSYRLAGDWDTRDMLEQLPLTLAPTPHGWKIVSDADDPAVSDAVSWRTEPWWGSAIAVVATSRVLVIGSAGQDRALHRLSRQVEALLPLVRARWPEESWNGHVVAYGITDPAFVRAWFGDRAAGAGRQGVVAEVAPVGQLPRVVVTPYLLGTDDPDTSAYLTHEITHVATQDVGREVPRWLTEGVAEYTAYRAGGRSVDGAASWARYPRSRPLRAALAHGSLDLIMDAGRFYAGPDEAVDLAYAQGWLGCLYIAHRYGDVMLRRVLDLMAAQPDTYPLPEAEDRTLRELLHLDTAQFTAAARAYGLSLAR